MQCPCPCKKVSAMRDKLHKIEIENLSLIASLKKTEGTLFRKQKQFDRIISLQKELSELKQIEKEVFILMHSVKEGEIGFNILKDCLKNKIDPEDLSLLYNSIFDDKQYIRNKSLAVIYSLFGIHPNMISNFLFLYERTIRKQIAKYYKHGVRKYLNSNKKLIKVFDNTEIQNAVFSTLHNPPILHGINRTSWTVKLIQMVVNKQGYKVGRNSVDKIIKNAGYRFRKAREVLTSNDPDYEEKLGNITNILQKLGPYDRFFSIDEYGPFAIKMKMGRKLVKADEYPIIPQWQKSKGFLIITAALELSTNQVTHFYSFKKNSEEMIKLVEILMQKYSGCRNVYLSWDAASWHYSKDLLNKINMVNKYRYRKKNNTPFIKIAPLPARAQFLNVIESVFSGMSSSIIQNSNYDSVEEAKEAIDRYFFERNEYYRNNPKRAGGKLWGKERVYPQFKEGQNCKNPRWR